MTVSKFNQQWYDMGRKARFQATLEAALSRQAVILPESSYNATAASFWRDGWNSCTLQELTEYVKAKTGKGGSSATPKLSHADQANPIESIKQRLGVSA